MNPEQQLVVAHGSGPLEVLAGAGTGKTHTLVQRIARLVREGIARPSRILVVTFSKDAARELECRLRKEGIAGVDVATWHSLAWRILREDEHATATWEVDRKGQLRRVISDACSPKGIDWPEADEAGITRLLGLAGANLWTRESVDGRAAVARMFGAEARLALGAWAEIDRLLAERRILTFDAMLATAVRYLVEEDRAREWWSARWDHVLQDEYQDANLAQVTFAELLARDHRNYVVVGDPGQSIYAFRGSSPSHLMSFAAAWSAPVVALVRNYRCGASILDVGNAVIAPARDRLPDPLIAERGVPGHVEVVTADNADDEAALIAEHILRERDHGARWSDFAILMRTNAQSRAVEGAFLRKSIPHEVRGAPPFFERREVRALLAYLRVASGKGSREDARLCINTPNRFLGRAFVEHVEVHRYAGERWTDAVRLAAAQSGIWSKQKHAASTWAALIENIERGIGLGQSPAQLLEHIATVTGYVDWLQRDQGEGDEGEGRASSVFELVAAARRFGTVAALLDFADQAAAPRRTEESSGDRVIVSSIHRAKGLEWPRVWVIGLVEGVLPFAKGDPDEERRLAYVAVTRARDELTLSWWAALGDREMRPSRFLFDAGLIEAPRRAAA